MSRAGGPQGRGLLALTICLALLPLVLPNKFFFDLAVKATLSAILCVGLNLLIGYAGQISLGHAGFFGLGAYASAVLTSGAHGLAGPAAAPVRLPPVAAMLVGAAFVALLAFLLARPILRLQGHSLAMATLGMGVIISIVLTQELDLTGGPDGTAVAPLSVLGWQIGAVTLPGGAGLGFPLPAVALAADAVWYAIVAAVLVFTVWLSLNLIGSPVGLALRAIHGSEAAAAVSGVDTARYKALVFVVSAVFASLAGSLFAHYEGFVTPREASFFSSITYVTMVVLGGRASVYGAVVGAAALTALPQLVAGFRDLEMPLFGLILMLTMILMPRGVVPTLAGALGRGRLP